LIFYSSEGRKEGREGRRKGAKEGGMERQIIIKILPPIIKQRNGIRPWVKRLQKRKYFVS
jgi:hypothetical protein